MALSLALCRISRRVCAALTLKPRASRQEVRGFERQKRQQNNEQTTQYATRYDSYSRHHATARFDPGLS